MKNTETFFQFPLYLWRRLFTNTQKTLNDISDYGIIHLANILKRDIVRQLKSIDDKEIFMKNNDIARQLVYGYYRDKAMPEELRRQYKKLGLNVYTDVTHGFSSKGMDDMAIEFVASDLEGNPDAAGFAADYYRLQRAVKMLGVVPGSYDRMRDNYLRLELNKPEGDPMPMISVKTLFQFRDGKKTEFEIALLAAFVAVRSIIGRNTYTRTNKQHIVARMFGYASIKHLPDKLPADIEPFYTKYSKRWWVDKLLLELSENWGIAYHYPIGNYKGGFYITSKLTLKDLVMKTEKTLEERREDRRRKIEEARKEYERQLKKEEANN